MKHLVQAYLDLPLKSLANILETCSVKERSFIDYWDGRWVMTQLNVSVTVNTAYPVLIRLCPLLLSPITDCCGLDAEIALQPRASKSKQSAKSDLVSPIKKAPRLETSFTASQVVNMGDQKAFTVNS